MLAFLSRALVVAAVAALLCCAGARAQEYPLRPVRVIIPLAAGGGGDVFTRALADELQKMLGQPVVVENRPGGTLNIGTRVCAEAPPDGYTLCVLSSEPVVYNQFLFRTLPFDPEKDLEPIALLFFNTLALVANSALQVATIPELIALAKAKPGTLSYGTFSFPASAFMEKLKREAGIDIVRVPFRGGGEVVTALLAGSTPIAVLALSNMVAQLEAGRIRGLAVIAQARSPLFPQVPTLLEVRGESVRATWFGLFAPAGMPRGIRARLAAAVTRIIEEPGFRRRMFLERAVEPGGATLEEFAQFIAEERKIAERLVRDIGVKPD
ncbi:MAG: Bug family tripartite tricarboxylate transporter substrate binding protein [Xanthobacteraceae bacterium]